MQWTQLKYIKYIFCNHQDTLQYIRQVNQTSQRQKQEQAFKAIKISQKQYWNDQNYYQYAVHNISKRLSIQGIILVANLYILIIKYKSSKNNNQSILTKTNSNLLISTQLNLITALIKQKIQNWIQKDMNLQTKNLIKIQQNKQFLLQFNFTKFDLIHHQIQLIWHIRTNIKNLSYTASQYFIFQFHVLYSISYQFEQNSQSRYIQNKFDSSQQV
ncbi:hypothetical protein ABPG72_015597 [Tetrahymena utriculariae]